jgi:hypothetical protein
MATNCHQASEHVISQALLLALVITRVRVVWHAGVISAEGAMRVLDQAIRATRVFNDEEAHEPR